MTTNDGKVLIVDYGMGNLGSVRRAFEECGAQVVISSDPRGLETASRIVLPGVGAFAEGVQNLKAQGWIDPIRKAVMEKKMPLLGICLGMQLLADTGHEGGEHAGLSLIHGEVRRLQPGQEGERIPHIGWNEVYQISKTPLFQDVADGTDFYFVHSYHFLPAVSETVVTKTPYCGQFISTVCAGNVFGVQFHPEKSSKAGFQVLRNFLALC